MILSEVPRRGIHNPPPDPEPRRPRHAVPPGSWDCHIHLFGPASKFSFAPESPYVSDDALPEDYFAVQDMLGLARAVVVSGGGYGTDYSHLKWVLARGGDRMRGVLLPRADISLPEMEELHRLGVRGVRMFGAPPGNEWDHLPRIDARIAAMIQDLGWHVQYHSVTRDDIADAADRLLALPGRIVIDHLGMFDPRLGLGQPASGRSCGCSTAGGCGSSSPARCARRGKRDYPYASITPYAQALAAHAPERMLWGSDWPHVQMNGRLMPNDGDLLDLLVDWAPDEATRFRILAQNPLDVYA